MRPGAIGAFLFWRAGRSLIGAVICGLVVAGIGLWDYYDIDGSDVEVGVGLYLTIGGGVVLGAAALTVWDRERRRAKNLPGG